MSFPVSSSILQDVSRLKKNIILTKKPDTSQDFTYSFFIDVVERKNGYPAALYISFTRLKTNFFLHCKVHGALATKISPSGYIFTFMLTINIT